MEKKSQDWRNAEIYKPIDTLDGSGLAWECLRRNPGYVAFARARLTENPTLVSEDTLAGVRIVKGGDANAWGLAFLEDPSLPASRARIFWSPAADRSVLSVVAEPAGRRDRGAFDIADVKDFATILVLPDGSEQILLANATHRVQLVVTGGTVLQGPVALWYGVKGGQGSEAQSRALMRFLHICRRRTFPKALFPAQRRAPRIAAILRAADARQAGATQREIAAALFDRIWIGEDWDARSDLRMRVQRLVRAGSCLIGTGYKKLLK